MNSGREKLQKQTEQILCKKIPIVTNTGQKHSIEDSILSMFSTLPPKYSREQIFSDHFYMFHSFLKMQL